MLLALGAYIRAHRFTNLDLWFDDAWAAIAGAGRALLRCPHVLTAPRLRPRDAQLDPLDPATTCCGRSSRIRARASLHPGVYTLVRWFR